MQAIDRIPGSLITFRGYALTTEGELSGAEKPLMYWLTICPGLQANGSEQQPNHDEYRSVYKQTWFATPNDVTIELAWDRRTDSITLNGQQHQRSDGNVFVVLREVDGSVSSWQIESPADSPHAGDVLKYVQSKLPENKFVRSVRLVQMDSD
jgi:hypothetical protein